MADEMLDDIGNLMDVDDDEDIASEAADQVNELGPNDGLWENIRDSKKKMPGMFVSAWEEDEDGIAPKNMNDPKEQFLTAAEEGNVERLSELLQKHPEFLHARDGDDYTPLHRAAYNNHMDACRYLLQIGANPEAKTENGWTVLHCAACWSNHAIVALLLSHGVDINAKSNGSLTPLHLAINSSEPPEKHIVTIKYLLEAPGVDMGAVTNAGDTPLILARRHSREIYELVEAFTKRP